jgi:gas vesicle protein
VVKQSKGKLVVVGFNYDLLESKAAEKVRSSADRIRAKVKRTMDDLIEVGNELLAAKEALPHGQLGSWLAAEFGWTERTARNFMAVAERFGHKTEIISDLTIQPTAAYLLAAPSTPDEARETAIERAEAGEQITTAVAKEILAQARKKKRPMRQRVPPTDKLGGRLLNVLERYKERWNPKELSELARHLREFADALEASQQGGRKKSNQ